MGRHQPAWSPDSRRLAFVSARHADRDYDHATDIFVVDAEGGEPVRVTPGDGVMRCQPGRQTDGASPISAMLTLRTPPQQPSVVGPGRRRSAPLSDRALDRDLEITETAAPIWQADGSAIVVGVQDRGQRGRDPGTGGGWNCYRWCTASAA